MYSDESIVNEDNQEINKTICTVKKTIIIEVPESEHKQNPTNDSFINKASESKRNENSDDNFIVNNVFKSEYKKHNNNESNINHLPNTQHKKSKNSVQNSKYKEQCLDDVVNEASESEYEQCHNNDSIISELSGREQTKQSLINSLTNSNHKKHSFDNVVNEGLEDSLLNIGSESKNEKHFSNDSVVNTTPNVQRKFHSPKNYIPRIRSNEQNYLSEEIIITNTKQTKSTIYEIKSLDKEDIILEHKELESSINNSESKQQWCEYNLTNNSSIRESNIDGSLTSFERAEDEINKEIVLKETSETFQPLLTYKKKSTHFRDLNDIKSRKDSNELNNLVNRVSYTSKEDNHIKSKTGVQNVVTKINKTSVDMFDDIHSPQYNQAQGPEKGKLCMNEHLDKSIQKISLINNYKKNNHEKYFSYNQSENVKNTNEQNCNVILNNENKDKVTESQINHNSVSDQENTLDEFENIFKNVTASNSTQFDLLMSQEDFTDVNLYSKKESGYEDNISDPNNKYNLRHRQRSEAVHILQSKINEQNNPHDVDIDKQLENTSKRTLRPRRYKNVLGKELNFDNVKLSNIENLQKEFSDITLDKPITKKIVLDIASPESSAGDEENVPPKQLQRYLFSLLLSFYFVAFDFVNK